MENRHEHRVDGFTKHSGDGQRRPRGRTRSPQGGSRSPRATFERDLQALRDDFGRLAEQVADIVADYG